MSFEIATLATAISTLYDLATYRYPLYNQMMPRAPYIIVSKSLTLHYPNAIRVEDRAANFRNCLIVAAPFQFFVFRANNRTSRQEVKKKEQRAPSPHRDHQGSAGCRGRGARTAHNSRAGCSSGDSARPHQERCPEGL